ncbi:MAG: septal ring lytic transglycosylase RlpA family protein [Sphingomonadaceae bacterium]|nr:septal ring lytic transglycosylase RlpA family protein [Sphingomonadaceae bacterium]
MKLGRPYTVLGQTYVPVDDRSYDETGLASWYGPGFAGVPTANGEPYDPEALTAAHRTLPLPSWVEVTNLDNGRQLVVRINDRGPFVKDRIIDLSRRSAELLGMERAGLARVRVRRVFPEGGWARSIPPLRLADATPAPAPARDRVTAGGLFVQVVALTDLGRAQFLAADLAEIAPSSTSRAPSGLWRVRLGPFADPRAAEAALGALSQRGFRAAWIVSEGG